MPIDLNDVWDQFIDTVKQGAGELAGNLLNGFKTEAQEDAEQFLALARDKIPKWTEALARGLISAQEYAFLLGSLKSLALLTALKAKGIAKVKIDQFREGLISLVIRAATGAIGL